MGRIWMLDVVARVSRIIAPRPLAEARPVVIGRNPIGGIARAYTAIALGPTRLHVSARSAGLIRPANEIIGRIIRVVRRTEGAPIGVVALAHGSEGRNSDA